MEKKIIFIIILIFLVKTTSNSETYTGACLKYPFGAAAAAGGNGALLSKSNESLSINPAMISLLYKYQTSLSYNQYPFDRNASSVSLIMQNQNIKFALNYYQFVLDKIEKRDLNGNLNGHFEDKTQIFYITLGNKKNHFLWGLNIKLISESVYEQKASAISFDFGSMYEIRPKHYIGYSIRNFDLTGAFSGELNPMMKWEVKLWNSKETNYEYKIGNSHNINYMGQWKQFFYGISYAFEQNGDDYTNLAGSYQVSEDLAVKAALYNGKPVWGFSIRTRIFSKYQTVINYSYYEEQVIKEPCHFITWTLIP